jgi:hypothetical protein
VITDFLGKAKISPIISEKKFPLYNFLVVLPHHTEDCLYVISKQLEMDSKEGEGVKKK